MKKIKIYQLPVEHEATFMNFEYVKEQGIIPSISDYKMVWEGELNLGTEKSIDVQLDIIFRRLNIAHPSDFKGHSLSVSDVVEMDGKFYYCDDMGWERIVFTPTEKKEPYAVRADLGYQEGIYDTKEEAEERAQYLNERRMCLTTMKDGEEVDLLWRAEKIVV